MAYMQYLVKLDGMVTQEGDGSLRWSDNIDVLALTAKTRARPEPRTTK